MCSVNAQTDTLMISPVLINSSFKSENQYSEQIDSVFIQQNSNLQLSNLLQQTSPVFIKSFGNNGVSTASFRGTSASHTQVLWNDISLNSPMLGQVDFSLVPVFFADKINLSAGSKSLYQSEGSLGGNILLNTNANWTRFPTFSVGQNIESFSNYTTFFKFSANNKKVLFDCRIISKSGVNNYKYYNNALPDQDWQSLENSNFYQISFLQQIYFRVGKKSVFSVYFWHTNSDRNISPIMSFEGLNRFENQLDKRNIAGFKFNSKIGKIRFKINTSISHNILRYYLSDSLLGFPQNSIVIKSNSISSEKNIISSAKISYKISQKIHFKTNIKTSLYKVATYDSATYSMIGYDAKRIKNNLTFILEYLPTDRIKSYFIISQITVNWKFITPSISVGISNEIIANRKLIWGANFGKNNHIPSLNDLFWQPGGNLDLKNESGYFADFFMSSFISKNSCNFEIIANPFISIINDWIIWQPSEYNYWTAQNLKKVLLRGIEMNFKFYKKGKLSYQFIANYALTISTDIILNKQLIYTPKNTANLFFHISYSEFNYFFDVNFTDKRFTNSSNNSFILPFFWIANNSISKNFNISNFKFKIEFNVNNIFNIQYQAILFRPMPGRNFGLKILLSL